LIRFFGVERKVCWTVRLCKRKRKKVLWTLKQLKNDVITFCCKTGIP
jgi:hypothetical protein